MNSTKLDPKTCTERLCHSSENLLYAKWISSTKVFTLFCKIYNILLLLLHIQDDLGCDCCEVNGELVPDKHTWMEANRTYGKSW